MPGAAMMRATAALARAVRRRSRRGRRGAVSILFAVALLPAMIGITAAVDFSRTISARSALQQAADNATLSGAAAYTVYAAGDALNAIARNMTLASFCDSMTTSSGGFAVVTSSGSSTCGSAPGPAVSATIAGVKPGIRGIFAGSGCSATNTVVAGATCGFVVTVSATATANSLFGSFLGATRTVSVTSSAMNPFINIAQAISGTLYGSASYANSVWVYPLLLDANGSPAITSSNPGALPDSSACTGDPTQTSCGSYSMIVSTNYINCPGQTKPACTVSSTTFGAGGAVQNPAAGAAVITATTPLGVAFESTSAGGYSQPAGTHSSYGYDRDWPPWGNATPYKAPGDNCVWPAHTAYNTVSQTYSPSDVPIYPWSLVTHWYYSSYLLSNMPPSQGMITTQLNLATNPGTGYPYNLQIVHSTPIIQGGVNVPTACTSPAPLLDYERYATTYPTVGNTNCSLYIVKDPPSMTPNSTYVGSCFNPASTPGQSYAALSCQAFAGHSFAFFWNDMGGLNGYDDMDYGNGTLVLTCTGQPHVRLIN